MLTTKGMTHNAARDGLHPIPTIRMRGAYPHLSNSYVKLYINLAKVNV